MDNNVTGEPAKSNYGYSGPHTVGLVSSKLPLNEQEKAISELHTTIEQLEARLSQVLGPDYPSPTDESAKESVPEVSSLARELLANNTGIYRAIDKIKLLMDRLEC